ncbi:hypothetical protein KCU73_g16294, partial [Aureobasidium melanogenum]
MAPPDDFGGHDVLRYEYIGEPYNSTYSSIPSPRQYSLRTIEKEWIDMIRHTAMDTAYNPELFSKSRSTFVKVVESFAPLVQYDQDIDESDDESTDGVDDTLQQSEAEATEDIHSSYNMVSLQKPSPADEFKFESYKNAECI